MAGDVRERLGTVDKDASLIRKVYSRFHSVIVTSILHGARLKKNDYKVGIYYSRGNLDYLIERKREGQNWQVSDG
jgi:hypothetical protein